MYGGIYYLLPYILTLMHDDAVDMSRYRVNFSHHTLYDAVALILR